MGMFTVTPPRLPTSPADYNASFMNQLLNVLYLYFQRIDGIQPINVAQLNFDLNTLPTDASLANLRSGDVYRDTTAGNVLKVKV
jgi:hypothetical protein